MSTAAFSFTPKSKLLPPSKFISDNLLLRTVLLGNVIPVFPLHGPQSISSLCISCMPPFTLIAQLLLLQYLTIYFVLTVHCFDQNLPIGSDPWNDKGTRTYVNLPIRSVTNNRTQSLTFIIILVCSKKAPSVSI